MSYTAENGPLQLRIALFGNPCEGLAWTEEQLIALKEKGFNAIQLNIAWLCRPNDEALNLCDVVSLPGEDESPRVAERRNELLRRNALAKKVGLRTLFHFGTPFMWWNPYTRKTERYGVHDDMEFQINEDPWFDVLNPLVASHEGDLLREFRRQFPDVDDILIYTFDQDAWQASEFGHSQYSRGIPLHQRLPGYLKGLHQIWTRGRENESLLWWEPWELSAGQIFKIVPQLPTAGFGLMLHNNIAEAQVARPVDVWFRNTARMAAERGIPVVGEGFFCSATEEIEPLSIPFPRLVDEELLAIMNVPGVVGVKEYYGVLPLKPDLSLDMFAARMQHPEALTEDLLKQIVARFGSLAGDVHEIVKLLSAGMQFFPWDASWFMRQAGRADLDHGWSGATIRGQMCETPSWRSTRHSHFMMTDDRQPHPFMLEDIQLRCEMAAESWEQALVRLPSLIATLQDQRDQKMFQDIAGDLEQLKRVAKSYALHLRETNVAMLLRQDLEAGRPMMQKLENELGELLAADAENQRNHGRIVQMRNAYAENPEAFVRTHLIPVEQTVLEKGYHTLTTR